MHPSGWKEWVVYYSTVQFSLVWVPRRGHRASEAFRFEPGAAGIVV